MSTPPNQLPSGINQGRRTTRQDRQDATEDTDQTQDNLQNIRERRGAGRQETLDAGTTDEQQDQQVTDPNQPTPGETPQEPPQEVQRAAGFGTSTPGEPTPAEQTTTREAVETDLTQQAVNQSPIFTDPSQLEVTDVDTEQVTRDGETQTVYTGTFAPTQGGRLRYDIYSRESAARRGPQTGQFRSDVQRRADIREAQIQQEEFAEDVATNQFARFGLRRQVARGTGRDTADVDVQATDSGLQFGFTTGGESRELISQTAQETQFTESQLETTVEDGDIGVQLTDEAFLQRAARETEGVDRRDLQLDTAQQINPADRFLFEQSTDQRVISSSEELGETRVAELTPEAQARELGDRLEERFPNADISITYEGEGDDREPVATVQQEGVVDTAVRVGSTLFEGGGTSGGFAGGPQAPANVVALGSDRQAAQAAGVGLGDAFVAGGEGIIDTGVEGVERDLGTLSDVLGSGSGASGGLVGGPGAPGTVAAGLTADIAGTVVRETPEAVTSIPGEFVAGGEEIASEAVSGAERDLGMAIDAFTSAETPLDPSVGVAAAPVAAPAGAVGTGTAGVSIGAGAAVAAPVAAGVGLGVGAIVGAQELERRTETTQTFRTTDLGIGGVVQDVSELEPDTGGVTELGVGETIIASEIEVPAETDRRGGEISVPEQRETVEIGVPALTTQQLIQRGEFEDDAREITDEDIADPFEEPEQAPPSVRERQRREDLDPFERTFPTGEGAVVGRGDATERAEEVETPEVTESDAVETDVGMQPVEGLLPAVGSNEDADVTEDVEQGQTVDVDQDVAQDVAFQQALGLGTATQAQLAQPDLFAQPGLVAQQFAQPEAFEFEFQTPNVSRPRRPRDLDLPEFDGENDEEEFTLLGDVGTEAFDFVNPITGDVLETDTEVNEPSLPGF